MSETDPAAAETAHGPEGSAYERAHGKRRARSPLRRLRRFLSRVFVGLVTWTVPYVYYAYCWFVWKTSTIDDRLTPPLLDGLDRHGRFVAILWHQEVFTVAYAYRHFDGHTLASTGNFGAVITRMLELCNFTVFRGGSSGAKTRKRRVLAEMIRHMKREPRVPYGITVDGSRGPRFRMKTGCAAIAKACRAPIFVTRMWYSRRVLLPTWDRTAIPLPFGRIHSWALGPYWIEPDATPAQFARACAHLQDELLELADLSFEQFADRDDTSLREGFPEGWRSRWVPGRPGLARTQWDLRPDAPPPWAHRASAAPERPQPTSEATPDGAAS